MRQKACIEVVIVASDGAFLVWDSRGTNYVAIETDALARWIIELAQDDETPTVEFGSPKGGAFMAAATRIVDTLSPKRDGAEELVGVHVVVQWSAQPWSAVVWAPKGGPKAALAPDKLGQLLATVAVDPDQPRVPAGAPPDPGAHLVDGVGTIVSNWLRPGGAPA